MSFTLLNIHHLRNLTEVRVTPAQKFNLLHGENGSGKTSFLEAIYYLGLGKSFRTHLNSRIINYDVEHFSLFAHIQQESYPLNIGLERYQHGELKIRINKENVSSIFEITKNLPIQILNAESQSLLTGYSKIRRRFMDWGVFHVEPSFLPIWQHTQRALKQRNAILKSTNYKNTIDFWDGELEKVSEQLNIYRKTYLETLQPILIEILDIFFKDRFDLSFKYKSGWDEEIGLRQTLKRTLERDLQLGYTQHGPHRSDLLIRVNKTIPAQDILSQGQQKLLVYALHLAQGHLLRTHMQKKCIFLLDDLPAELDDKNQRRVVEALNKIDAQVFITAVDRKLLEMFESYPETQVFHVEHGQISAM